MSVSITRTVTATEVIERPYGAKVEDLKRPLTDLGFNLRVKNIQRELSKFHKK
jgi:hypothetical protein